MTLIHSVIFLIAFFILSLICKKKKFLLDQLSFSDHKKLTVNKRVPLLGGAYFLYIFIFNVNDQYFFLSYFLFAYFLVGLLSDLNFLNKPIVRFLIQTIILFTFFNYAQINILSTRIAFLDNLLSYEPFNLLFCTFCSLILINGFNFIDGVNGLSMGYFVLIFSSLLYFFSKNFDYLSFFTNGNFLILLVILFTLILFGFIFLGDAGSYIIGFVTSVMIININYLTPEVSPWFIIFLVWYPSYEVLFSILRKFITNTSSPFSADKNHLHQLLFKFYKKRFKTKYANSFSSLSILFYIFLNFLVAKNFLYDSVISIFLILFNLMIYTVLYFKLYANFKNS